MAAFACTQCGHINPHGALYCEKCFALLLDTHPVSSQTMTIDPSTLGLAVQAKRSQVTDRLAQAEKLNPHTVALYVASRSEPLIVVVVQQAILGRVAPHDAHVRIDLSHYDGLDKGVSRQHATLKRTNNKLMIEDLGSSNGTWLNGELLQPYQPATLVSGARLRLGQLELEIYFPKA